MTHLKTFIFAHRFSGLIREIRAVNFYQAESRLIHSEAWTFIGLR